MWPRSKDINWSKCVSSNKTGSVQRGGNIDEPNEKPGLLSWKEKDQSKQGLLSQKLPPVGWQPCPHPAETLKADQVQANPPIRIYWASPMGTVAWDYHLFVAPWCLVQNRSSRCHFVGGLVFSGGDSLFKKGNYWEKKITMGGPQGKHLLELYLSFWSSWEVLAMWGHLGWGLVCLLISVTQRLAQCWAHSSSQ